MMDKLRTINPEQIAALLRTIGQVFGGVVATRGWMTENEWIAVSGALGTVILTAWGIFARRDSALITSAANVPVTEKVVVATPVVVSSESLTENPKVVPPTSGDWP
jgi:xanthine dehydrogenase molybdopterin-binding subunit B